MAIATVEVFPGLTGQVSATLELSALGVDSVTVISLTEATNRTGLYTGTTTAGLAGEYQARMKNSAGSVIYTGYVQMDNTATLHRVVDNAAVGDITGASMNLGAVNGDQKGIAGFQQAIKGITTGVVGIGSSTTSIVTSSLSPAANISSQFVGQVVSFNLDTTTVALQGQKGVISASTAGGVLTVSTLTTAPVSGDTFTID
jgi:hypothetical protein